MTDYMLELPWQEQNWKRLLSAKVSGRLPHALLLTGTQGLGKYRFAVRLAASLLCKSPDQSGRPCGSCQSCHLFKADTHPDFTLIEPEGPGKAIKIDTIREFTEKESLTSQSGGYKVTIIEPADAMNTAAVNSLLKTLEEPVSWTVMILISNRPGRLLATVRSRCQQYAFSAPDRRQSVQWLSGHVGQADPALLLALGSGAPLEALKLADPETLSERKKMLDEFVAVMSHQQDPVMAAERWNKQDLSRSLHWLCGWLIDMIRLKMVPESPGLINLDQRECLQALGLKLESRELYLFLDRVYQAIRTLGSQLNSQMILEGVLLMASKGNNN